MTKLRIQAQHLQPGDIVGSGEKILYVGSGIKTTRGKIDIELESQVTFFKRWTQWGKYTMINVERME